MSLNDTVEIMHDLVFDRGYVRADQGKEIQSNDQSTISRFYKPGQGGPISYLKINTVKLTEYEYRFDIDYEGDAMHSQDLKYLNWEIQEKIDQLNAQ